MYWMYASVALTKQKILLLYSWQRSLAVEETEKVEKKTAKTTKKPAAKVAKVKAVHYSGNKVIETTAAATAQ